MKVHRKFAIEQAGWLDVVYTDEAVALWFLLSH